MTLDAGSGLPQRSSARRACLVLTLCRLAGAVSPALAGPGARGTEADAVLQPEDAGDAALDIVDDAASPLPPQQPLLRRENLHGSAASAGLAQRAAFTPGCDPRYEQCGTCTPNWQGINRSKGESVFDTGGICNSMGIPQFGVQSLDGCANACESNNECKYYSFGRVAQGEDPECLLFTDEDCTKQYDASQRFTRYVTCSIVRQDMFVTNAAASGYVSTYLNPYATGKSNSDEVCDVSLSQCYEAVLSYHSGSVRGKAGGKGHWFADRYRLKGCFIYNEGEWNGYGFYGMKGELGSEHEVEDVSELPVISTATDYKHIIRPPKYPYCYPKTNVWTCSEWRNTTYSTCRASGCTNLGGDWEPIASILPGPKAADQCKLKCESARPGSKYNRVCCFWSQEMGCWRKPGALPTCMGTGETSACGFHVGPR